jgi:transcription elongation factor Elf1
MERLDYDAIAARLLLNGSMANLMRLAAHAKANIDRTFPCPDCDHEGPHDDNGDTRETLFCCAGCGLHFEAPAFSLETR